MTERASFSVEHLNRLLPEVAELEELRLRIIGASQPDPDKLWDRSTSYATYDKRVLNPEQIQSILGEYERDLHEQISSAFVLHQRLFESFYAGRLDGVGECLVELAGAEESRGRYPRARAYLERALSVSLPLSDKSMQVVVLRRLARVARSQGDHQEALSFYRRSAELSSDSGDLHSEVVARTGVGTVFGLQGRWSQAEEAFLAALAVLEGQAGQPFQLERGQLYNNLGTVVTRQGRLAEAERWFESAAQLWLEVSSPTDQAIHLHNLGLLRDRQARSEEARACYLEALSLSLPFHLRAAIAGDLAQSFLTDGVWRTAVTWAREAEQQAISSGAPYYIANMYRVLGKVMSAHGDGGGITFFEKALEIARERSYALLEGETLVDYGVLRQEIGDAEEAISYLLHAREIFSALGAAQEIARVDESLIQARAASASVPAE